MEARVGLDASTISASAFSIHHANTWARERKRKGQAPSLRASIS